MNKRSSTRRAGGWLKRVLQALLALVIVLAVAGFVYQSIGEASDARRFPPPGQLLDVGGYKLHLNCSGPEHLGNSTVILDTLSGGSSIYWGWIQPKIAQTTRVCSYDRAGFGWSESAPQPPDLNQMVVNLHTLLGKANVPGPYVLVGHSIGGIYVRQFAAIYPSEVAGLVLLDAAHPLQLERHPDLASSDTSMLNWMPAIQTLTRLGLGRLYFALGGEVDFKDLPSLEHAELVAFWSSSKHWQSQQGELASSSARFEQAKTLPALGKLPLAVVTAGTHTDHDWLKDQDELGRVGTSWPGCRRTVFTR